MKETVKVGVIGVGGNSKGVITKAIERSLLSKAEVIERQRDLYKEKIDIYDAIQKETRGKYIPVYYRDKLLNIESELDLLKNTAVLDAILRNVCANEDHIKNRLQDLNISKGVYMVKFNYGYLEVVELSSDIVKTIDAHNKTILEVEEYQIGQSTKGGNK